MALTREQILAADDLPRTEVEVPEWGDTVFVRTMTAGEHARLGVDFESIPKDRLALYVLAKCLCDAAGHPLFSETADDLEALGRKNKDVVGRLFEVASRVNKLAPADADELAKN